MKALECFTKLYPLKILRNLAVFSRKGLYISTAQGLYMKKGLVIFILTFIVTLLDVLAQDPYVDFTEIECNDLGVLSFKAEYQWNGYTPGYVYLKSVKINAIKGGETIPLKGKWLKFKTEEFLQSEIKLHSPTAYFFSNEGFLEEGSYALEIDYAVSKGSYERFKKQFTGTVSCPKQKKIIEEVEDVPKEEPAEEKLEEKKPETIPTEPPLFGEESKNYTIYYVTGLLVAIFAVSIALMKKVPRRHTPTKRIPSSKNISNLFERKH